MSNDKATELKVGDKVQLVAVSLGFVDGAMVHPGTKFTHTVRAGKDGKPPRLPKWAQPADIPLPKKPVAGDLKPKSTQEQVAKKRGELADGAALA